ncbi:ATP-binding cassette domain-containing protein [Alteromonas sediminis]|uniref:ATP-binding cassette domain-containing protein n=1 Tax=Alteromonas sediminis TaxID=2259342 RepID=A0A3N5Y0Q4_9ALTE|nr:ATP-binding cassette domain-containing protein [Alteromonas sediminis]RPJ67287.1 ATP-binding cassette domain-containing protein [Alteromonas sediminis]
MDTSISNSPVLSCRNIVKRYDDGVDAVTVLRGVSLDIAPGSQIAIVGASGSGKSSLLHILGALDTPNEGDVFFLDHSILSLNRTQQAHLRNKYLGFVYQFHHLLNEFSALENVAMPLLISGEKAAVAMEKASSALDKVGLSHRKKHAPNALSGGERQRTAIARAIVNSPKVVLADEPTGNLDAKTGEQVYELMLSLQADLNMAFAVVTHDLTLAKKMSHQYQLHDGMLQEYKY